MAAGPDRLHRRLHNFNLHSLRWGSQRLLRSIKIQPCLYSSDPDDGRHQLQINITNHTSPDNLWDLHKTCSPYRWPSTESPIERLKKLPPLSIKAEDDIEKVREKLLVRLRTVIDSREDGVAGDGEGGRFSDHIACKLKPKVVAPDFGIKSAVTEEKSRLDESSPAPLETRPKSLRLRGLAPASIEDKKNEIPRLSISLSRREIDEDFFAMTGSRPSRRPKKRARIIQKKIDETFPGLWLSNITPDSYKVHDVPESRKS